MTSTSIICVKKEVEAALEALSSFGEFHIEHGEQEEKSLSEYSKTIQKTQETLSDVIGLTKQLVQEKTSLFAMFKIAETTKIVVTTDNWQTLLEQNSKNIASLKEESDRLNASLSNLRENKLRLVYLMGMLTHMDSVGADFETIERLKLIYVTFASVPVKNFNGLETALEGLPVFMNRSVLTKELLFVSLALPAKHHPDVDRILKTYHAEIFHIPSGFSHNVQEALKQVNSQLGENTEKQKQICETLKKMGEENKDNLTAWTETQENILSLLNAETKILQSGRIATIKGFVPAKKFQQLNEKVTSMMQGKIIVLKDDVGNGVNEASAPTKILNNRFIKPFEELTRLYGLPKYDEVDPTPILAITFPILFGLMFGDVGHGLVLLIGGLVMGLLIKTNRTIKNVCFIMAACGIGAIFAGFLFGEFFGTELSWGPLWFSPFHGGVFDFIIFSLFVGIVQIISGIVLEMVNFALKHNIADALLTSIPKIAFYVGGVYIIVTCQLNFGLWLSGPILAAIVPFVVLVIGKPVYLAVVKPKRHTGGEHAELDTVSGRLFEGGDLFTRLLSNTISYSRILALLMAHWALMLVVYEIAGMIGTANILTLIVSGVVIIGGNIFVLALEGLIVFIHTLRLHFYEWFSKFYAGSGAEFNPFKQSFIHTKLTLKKK